MELHLLILVNPFFISIPIDSATEVPLDIRIFASSNIQIDPTTINTTTFTLKNDKNTKTEGIVILEGGNTILNPKNFSNQILST